MGEEIILSVEERNRLLKLIREYGNQSWLESFPFFLLRNNRKSQEIYNEIEAILIKGF